MERLKTYKVFKEGLEDRDIISGFRRAFPDINCSDEEIMNAKDDLDNVANTGTMGLSRFYNALKDIITSNSIPSNGTMDVVTELIDALRSKGIRVSTSDYDSSFGVLVVNKNSERIIISFFKGNVSVMIVGFDKTRFFNDVKDAMKLCLDRMNIDWEMYEDDESCRFNCEETDFNKILNL